MVNLEKYSIDDKVIPNLIYEYLKDKPKVFFDKPNLNRLRYILENSFYNGNVLMKNNNTSKNTYMKLAIEFIGEEFKYSSEPANSHEKLNSMIKDLKEISNRKKLFISFLK